ncbi:hypothetical protein SH449x_005143 [Pirellulaceae bacterium SH449]
MKLMNVVGVLLATATCALHPSAIAQEVEFRWKLAEGTTLQSIVSQETQQGEEGAATPVSQKTEMTQDWMVRENYGDGTALVVTILRRAQLTLDIPGAGKIEVDTSKEDGESAFAQQIAKMFRPLIDAECSNSMSVLGKIADVKIPETALAGFRNTPGGANIESMIKESIENGSPVFPAQPIAPGFSWSQVTSNKTPTGLFSLTNQYTYKGTVNLGGRALHEFTVTTNLAFAGDNNFGAKISIPAQKITGKMLFDNELGYLVASEQTQEMTMEIEVPNQKPSRQTLKQKMITKFLQPDQIEKP